MLATQESRENDTRVNTYEVIHVRGLGVTREADDGKGDEGKVWGRWGDEGEEGMSRGGSESI